MYTRWIRDTDGMRSLDLIVGDVIDLIAIIEWPVGGAACLVFTSNGSRIETDLLEDVPIG
jgi:hypothetical protein